MKKSKYLIPLFLGLFLVLSINGGLMAQEGGFTEKSPQANANSADNNMVITTAKNALTMADDANVVLLGKIVRSAGEDKYVFRDSTGELTLEIDDHIWDGQNVTSDDFVVLLGQIDKEVAKDMEVDVHHVQLVRNYPPPVRLQ
jgi:uncharacterized protein (TIGR00156 family)